ncbi:13094_t:CDS:2 [Ambispora gerdemannii]|uniref:13094_t:CDS:1 n=1 Tax=Ambispora gerdemannii TaxID=144530 RepID=A0A9N8WMM5_9GLOM|nr:13094_t:CDS:2 [Ambispora gerdemannii]
MSAKYAIRRQYAIKEIVEELRVSSQNQPLSPTFQTTLAFTETFMLTQPPPSPLTTTGATKTLRIAVLDSSFNPPTKAHLQLLLKSVNTHASQVDRILMMESLAYEIHDKYSKEAVSPAIAHTLQNIAVGITSSSRFIDKPDAISHSLSSRNQPPPSSSHSSPPLTLYFIMGYDTLIRLFDPRYYTDMHKELSLFFATNYVIYANRAGFEPQEIQQFFKTNEAVQCFRHKIWRVESEESVAALSSTRVRRLLNGWKQEEENQIDDAGVKIKGLLYEHCPASVADYMLKENLYWNQKL